MGKMKISAQKLGLLVLAIALVTGAAVGYLVFKSREEAGSQETEEVSEEIALPTEDVEGEDLSDVPRYPGSVRTGYITQETEEAGREKWISYATSAGIDEIRDFYARELPANGWNEVAARFDETDESGEILWTEGTKGDRYVAITYSASEDYSGNLDLIIYENIP